MGDGDESKPKAVMQRQPTMGTGLAAVDRLVSGNRAIESKPTKEIRAELEASAAHAGELAISRLREALQ